MTTSTTAETFAPSTSGSINTNDEDHAEDDHMCTSDNNAFVASAAATASNSGSTSRRSTISNASSINANDDDVCTNNTSSNINANDDGFADDDNFCHSDNNEFVKSASKSGSASKRSATNTTTSSDSININEDNTNKNDINTDNKTLASDSKGNKEINDDNDLRSEEEKLRLRRNLGLIPAVSYVAGGMIGVGIFVSPQMVLINSGFSVGLALCVWGFSALLAFCGALTFAELGTRISKSGGAYTYIKEAYGELAGFLYLWTQVVVIRPMATAVVAMAAAEYTLRPVFLECPHLTPRMAKVFLAVGIISFITWLNSSSTKWGASLQTLTTVCKLSALVSVVVVGIISMARQDGPGTLEDNLFSPQGLTIGKFTLAVYMCNYAYYGWDTLNMATEEIKHPQRNIPLATMLGVGITGTIYILVNLSYCAVLTTPQIVSGLAIAVLFLRMTVPPLMWFIVPCIAMSAIGVENTIFFVTTRLNFIGGRDGLFPEVLSMVSVSRRTPVVSCIFLGVAASAVAFAGDVISVLGAFSSFRALLDIAAVSAIFRLRKKFPATKNTYLVPTVVPVFFLMVHLALFFMTMTGDTFRYITPLLFALCGVPLYFLSSTRMFTQGPLRKMNDMLVSICRKLLLCDFAAKTY